ncbi:MAG: hypothetical protein NTZ78_04745 [Candidatus Aureabacteria bacterium]|nr:hypothetical protein [Candidatus Auribacterota bacterium]
MKRKRFDIVLILAFCVAILFALNSADAVSRNDPFLQRGNARSFPDVERDDLLRQPIVTISRIGRIIKGHNLIWGESIGWVNLRTTHTDLKIGSNMLAGWVWLENCGWVCLGEGHPLDGRRYSNWGAYDWGINNDGKGNLSGYAWSEVTGWISFRTGHSGVYLDESGQFYGYAWGETAGWMHFGPGRTLQYLAKADLGPWKEIGREEEDRLAGGSDDSKISSGSVPVTVLGNNSERYKKHATIVYLLRLGRDDFCARIRCYDTPVHISSLAKLSPIRAPPAGI